MNVIRCLTNENSIKGNVSLEGAKILCGSKEAFDAAGVIYYAMRPLLKVV